ncbi:MAG: acyl-CoA dehydrogenase [Deltaproteobacteria bacterium]|nr:acyl-CoA dehydrogenase [Deltaproteobacteria bacterium]
MGINYFKRNEREFRFILHEYIDTAKLLSLDAYKDFSMDDFDMILDQAMKVCREVIGPTNTDGDREGVKFENGKVTVPKSFHECWRVMAENGWMSLTNNPEYGGQGLPLVVGGAASEFFIGANMAYMCYPGLSIASGRAIETFGSDKDKQLYVEKMFTGVWGGTMCLTEPHAGSDVGYLATKAVKDGDYYKIEGTKIFITSGDHDLTENIIHLVLARIEGAPVGTKGISLFIVPKVWVNDDGSLGEPNDVSTGGVEHKMGVAGSATAVLNFGENGKCRGILLGDPHTGMSKMFQVMNEARLAVALQALGLTGSAYHNALDYAKERIQGPLFTDRAGERVRIIEHEDVRRMLMNLKSGVEAMRAFTLKLLFMIDLAHHSSDPQEKSKMAKRVELFVPLAKSYTTDLGYQLIRDAIQVLGGAGYTREFPLEQYARDIKICSIWEGTNYIQALDLIGRKLPMDGGGVFKDWIDEVFAFVDQNKEDEAFKTDLESLKKAAGQVGDISMRFMKYFQEGRLRLIPLMATRFLDSFAEVAFAQCLLEQGLIAKKALANTPADSSDTAFYRGKIETAKYFARNILPNAFGRYRALVNEDTSALDIPEEAF